MIGRLMLLPLLLPSSIIFGGIAFFRGLLYSSGLAQTYGFPSIRVISIGNITSGGTGKTPLSLKILGEAKKRNLKASYLSRGYGRSSKGFRVVNPQSAPVECGDEALLIKKTFADIQVAVCEDRVLGLEKLFGIMAEGFLELPIENVGSEAKAIVIADDSFQHRRLRRDLDIVLIDMTVPVWNYLPLPLGYGREGFAALKRAGVVVLTRCESATKGEILSMRKRLVVLDQKNVFESHFAIHRISNLSDGEPTSIEGPVLLVSSIGNPASFKKMVERQYKIVGHLVFSDHFSFDLKSLKSIKEKFGNSGASRILITEKDAVKIAPLTEDKSKFAVAHLKMEIEQEDQFYDLIFSVKRQG